MKIAVLLTTYNRKEKTINCLNSLKEQKLDGDICIDIYLTDDASSDGTLAEVAKLYPDAHLFSGTGSLFWAGGMRSSWGEAVKRNYDYYLLLNDDTILNKSAIATLLSYNTAAGEDNQVAAICIGSTCDVNGKRTYGGRKLSSKIYLKSNAVHSENEFMDCDLGNANIMLVPKQVVLKIGILSDAFTHGIADFDYTLRAKRAGFKVVVAPGFLGTCVHDHGKNWKSSEVTLRDRIKYLKSPKGLAYSEYLGFIKQHFPIYYPAAFTKLWLKTLFPFLWDTLKK